MKEKILRWEWLIIVTCLGIWLRIPSLWEPYWYWDEGVYLTIGRAIRNGVSLYGGIFDHKTPLIYVMAAIAGGEQFWLRLILAGWQIMTIIGFGVLINPIFKSSWAKFFTCLVFVGLTTLPIWEGNVANAELFFIGANIVASIILVRAKRLRSVAAAGIIIGLGGLFKASSLIELGVFPVVWLAQRQTGAVKKSLVLGLAAMTPILASLAIFAGQGTLNAYVESAWLRNYAYITDWENEQRVDWPGLELRTMAWLVCLTAIAAAGKRISPTATWIGIWGATSLYASLLSGRPYAHYLIQAAPAVSLAAGWLVFRKGKERVMGAVVVAAVAATYHFLGFYEYKTIEYYKNFTEFATGKISREEYLDRFDSRTGDNYKIAGWIKAGSEGTDKMFVWGDQPILYAMAERLPTGKYVSRYHIRKWNGETETMKAIRTQRPKYIVSYGEEEQLPGLGQFLENDYRWEKTTGEAKVYKLR